MSQPFISSFVVFGQSVAKPFGSRDFSLDKIEVARPVGIYRWVPFPAVHH